MTRGILMIALGHSNYHHMAVMLAASIKDAEPTLNICLVTDTAVSEKYAKLFDQVKTAPKKIYQVGQSNEYIKAKLFMYDLSPYDETIFLDVDQIVIPGRKLSPVFTELKDVDLTFSNTGLAGTSVWVDLEEVKKMYGDKKPFWNFHSEFVYFKKADNVNAYFQWAKKIYQTRKLKTVVKFGNGRMADELAFQLAALETGLYPHKENWTPNFWFNRHKNLAGKYPYQLTDFITYSIGGNHLTPFVKAQYNILAKSLFAKMKLPNPYQVTDKRTFLPERSKI